MLAEMSHKGGADTQVAERAGNDLERWLLGLNEVLANTHLSPSVRREVENAIRKYRH